MAEGYPRSVISLSVILMILGLIAGVARGGKVSNLASIDFKAPYLVFAGLGIQIAAELYAAFVDPNLREGGKGLIILAISYAFLIAFVALNRGLPGSWFIGIGLALNLLVIMLNQGMPVSARAASIAGIDSLEFLESEVKHRLMTRQTRLRFLGDIIPLPYLQKVLSIGDVILGLGVFLLVESAVRYRPKRLNAAPVSREPGPEH